VGNMIWGVTLAALVRGQDMQTIGWLLAVGGLLTGKIAGLLQLGIGFFWANYWQMSAVRGHCSDAFWFLCSVDSAAEPGRLWLESTWLGYRMGEARAALAQACLQWHPHWGPWALGLLGGQEAPGSSSLVQLYKELGLVHVLVISGSHFSFLAGLLSGCFSYPVRCLYVIRLLSFRRWLTLHLLLEMFILCLITQYALLVALPPPCQRAWLAWVVGQLRTWSADREDPNQELLTVAWLQALLFPLSWLSLSNALSWAAWASLVRFSGRVERQCCISLLSLGFFAAFNPLGFVLNIALEPLWNLVLAALVASLTTGWGQTLLPEALDVLHQGLAWCLDLQIRLWGGVALRWDGPLAPVGRCLAVLVACGLLTAPLWRRKR